MNKQPKNKDVQSLLERQVSKKKRVQKDNPLIVPKNEKKKNKEEPEERKTLQVPKSLHKKIGRIAVTDEMAMYEVLENAMKVYEDHRRRQ